VKLIAALLMMGMAASPTLALDQSVVEANWQKYIKDQHRFYCAGASGPCNACEAWSGGQSLGRCQTDISGPIGSPCRCASTQGWQKGWLVQIDPVAGWTDRRGEPIRKKKR
jgi:hypothetical protein